jgi:hypothetical protein
MKCLASNENLLEKIREEERQRMARLYTVATAYTALDKNGLCQNTVVSLIAGVMDVADSIIKGYTKLEDYERVIEEEYKTAIRFTNDKKGANE